MSHDLLARYTLKLTTPEGHTLYLRALSDGQRSDAEAHALAASYAHRKALKDVGSPAYLSYLAWLEDASTDELKEAIRSQSEMVAWVRAYRASPNPPSAVTSEPPPPSDDPLEAREQAHMGPLVADAEARASAARERQRIVDAFMRDLGMRLDAMPIVALRDEAMRLSIQTRANTIYQQSLSQATVALATYADAAFTERPFEVGGWIPPDLRAALDERYKEVGNVATSFLTERR